MELAIDAGAADTGRHLTCEASNYCRTRPTRRRIHAVDGDIRPREPVKGRASLVDVNWHRRIVKSGVKLWHIGTDTAKNLVLGALRVTQPWAGQRPRLLRSAAVA